MLVYQPFKLGLSIGNEYINFQIGRNRQEFGNGIIGNMLVGDNFSYQDMMRFSVFSDIFSYYLSFTHFDNVSPGRHTSFSFNGPHQTRLIHRFDFNILNKVRFVFNMGGLFTTDSPFDWRMFTPMMVVHNWCNNKPSTTISQEMKETTSSVSSWKSPWQRVGFSQASSYLTNCKFWEKKGTTCRTHSD